MNAPCMNCRNRYVGCHSNCEAYSEFTDDVETLKAKRREKVYLDAMVNDHEKDIRRKLKRNKR